MSLEGQRKNGFDGTVEPVFKMGQTIYCKGSLYFGCNVVEYPGPVWFEKQNSQCCHRNKPAFTLRVRKAKHFLKNVFTFFRVHNNDASVQ